MTLTFNIQFNRFNVHYWCRVLIGSLSLNPLIAYIVIQKEVKSRGFVKLFSNCWNYKPAQAQVGSWCLQLSVMIDGATIAGRCQSPGNLDQAADADAWVLLGRGDLTLIWVSALIFVSYTELLDQKMGQLCVESVSKLSMPIIIPIDFNIIKHPYPPNYSQHHYIALCILKNCPYHPRLSLLKCRNLLRLLISA